MDGVRIWLRRAVCAVALVAAVGIVLAGDVVAQGVLQAGTDEAASEATYYGAVRGVLTKNCVGCHSENTASLGGITPPMALTSYQVARRWASRIATAVQDNYMPPWDADLQHQGVFKDERYISNEDKQTLIAWAKADAPMGDPSEAGALVNSADVVTRAAEVAPDGSLWRAGVPDITFGFEEPVLVCEEVEDWQPRLPMQVVDGEITEPKWIRSMEINTGPSVHHTVSSHLGVGVPGRGPFEFPEGWGILLTEDPYVSISMHYHKEAGPGTAVLDDTRGGMKFYENGDVIDHVVETDIQAFGDFTIPAGHPNYEVRNQTHFDEDIYLLSMGPHAHYRGKAVKIELERPDRPFRETLLSVPDYDFNWQFQYELEEPYLIPAGSTMHITWWYDNSAANPYNPDPTVDVSGGPATTDEMMNARIYFARTKPLGLVVGADIPEEIVERSRAAEERARSRAIEWEEEAQSCGVRVANRRR
jgi:mono/diheme cytochrome c family protein